MNWREMEGGECCSDRQTDRQTEKKNDWLVETKCEIEKWWLTRSLLRHSTLFLSLSLSLTSQNCLYKFLWVSDFHVIFFLLLLVTLLTLHLVKNKLFKPFDLDLTIMVAVECKYVKNYYIKSNMVNMTFLRCMSLLSFLSHMYWLKVIHHNYILILLKTKNISFKKITSSYRDFVQFTAILNKH